MVPKNLTLRVILVIFFLAFEINAFSQENLSKIKPQNLSVSFNGTFIKTAITKSSYRCNSDNGIFGCNYDIVGVSDEIRQIENFKLYKNGELLFNLPNPPGSEIEISNAGFVIFMDTRNHFKGEIILHFYSKSGGFLFTETFINADLFGFSPSGNKFGVGAENGLSIISIPTKKIDLFERAFRFAISEDEDYVAIANPNEVKVFYKNELIQTIKTNLELTRKVCISSDSKIVCAIDKRNLKVFSLKNGKLVFSDKIDGFDSFRDISIFKGKILAGIHYRNNGISKGSIKVFDNHGKTVDKKEMATKKFEDESQKASVQKAGKIQWPLKPFNEPHVIWNYYETLMAYSGYTPYTHQGVDIITEIGEKIYAVEAGYVKCRLTTSASGHWRVAISPTQTSGTSNGYMYAHLIQSTIQFDVGDQVQVGDYLGDVIEWHDNWGHLHFVEIRDHGTQWSYSDGQWGITSNPLLVMEPITDTQNPVFQNVYTDSKFGFYTNQTTTKLDPNNLSGDIDIVVKIEDYIGTSTWNQPAYETYYWVNKLPENTTVFQKTLGQKLNHPYDTYTGNEYEQAASTIFMYNSQFPALGWFTKNRNYYHILTNNNGDETLDPSEKSLAFKTSNYTDGNYRIFVEAKDVNGNTTTQSMDVTFNNNNIGSDTEAPSAPSGLSSSNITNTGVTLNWTASTDNVGVTGYDIFNGSNDIGDATTTTFDVTGLTAETTYSFTVKAKDAAGNVSAASNTVSVTTTGGGCNYCAAKGDNQNYEWITGVTVGSFTNSSDKDAGGYGDYTSKTVNLSAGSSVSVTLTPNTTQYTEHFKVWIDYNGDCDFTDSGEEVLSGSAQGNTTGTIAVPASASGTTRMRVSMQYNSAPSGPCANPSYGEVEDYSVSFSGGGIDTEAPSVPTNFKQDQIGATSVSLSWTASTDNVGVVNYTVNNTTNNTNFTANSTSYSITGLTANTTYSFRVRANDAAGNSSEWTSNLLVTTSSGTDTEAPSAPTGLSSSNVTNTGVTLSWTASTDNVGVTGYDIFNGSTDIGDATTTTYDVTGLTAGTTYSFTVKAKDAAGNVSAASNAVSVTTTTDGCSYCAAKGTSQQYEWITGVTVGSFTKTSDKSAYSDFTNETINLTAGSIVSVTLTPNTTQYTEYFKVWIDYNGDCDFTDSGEEVLSGSNKGNTTGTISVPASASGTTRMRVSMLYNSAPSGPCTDVANGEVEDYTVSFSGGGSDTEPPSAPTGLSSSNVTQTGVSLSWTASTDNVGVTGYDIFNGSNDIGDATTTTFDVTGLTAETTYSFTVKAKDAAGNVSSASNTVSVTTIGGGCNYCAAKGDNQDYEWITSVTVGSFTNSSGKDAGGYGDYTSKTVNLNAGSSVSVTLTPNTTQYTEHFKVWIDYNGDCDFTDAGEEVFSGSAQGNTTGTFTVSSSVNGTTRMRVSMKYNSTPDGPCTNVNYGEVEDYTVNISQAKSTPMTNLKEADFNVYPNPSDGLFHIKLDNDFIGEMIVNVFNMNGQLVSQQKVMKKIEQEIIEMEIATPGIYNIQALYGGKVSEETVVIE